jgi:hypothetical protein
MLLMSLSTMILTLKQRTGYIEAALCRLTVGTVDHLLVRGALQSFVESTTYSSLSLISPSKLDN